jgi:hypothetical protein
MSTTSDDEDSIWFEAVKEFFITIGCSLVPFILIVIFYVYWNDLDLGKAFEALIYSGDLLIYGITISGPILHAILKDGPISYKRWLFFGWIVIAFLSIAIFNLIKPVSIQVQDLNQNLFQLVSGTEQKVSFNQIQNLVEKIREEDLKDHQKTFVWNVTIFTSVSSLILYFIYLLINISDIRKHANATHTIQKKTNEFAQGYSRKRGDN